MDVSSCLENSGMPFRPSRLLSRGVGKGYGWLPLMMLHAALYDAIEGTIHGDRCFKISSLTLLRLSQFIWSEHIAEFHAHVAQPIWEGAVRCPAAFQWHMKHPSLRFKISLTGIDKHGHVQRHYGTVGGDMTKIESAGSVGVEDKNNHTSFHDV